MKGILCRRPRSSLLVFALAAIGVLAVASPADASHVRPRGATPTRISLVPAYAQCTAPNTTHGAPLAFPSCRPPVQASGFLTVGTPDANGAPAGSVASVFLQVVPASFDGELRFTGSISDVRCLPATNASVCNSPNAADGPDYSGDVQFNAMIRISDHYNGQNLNQAATVQDIPFPVRAPCFSTADTTTGGVCNFTTSSCTMPQGCSVAGRRTVVELGQFEVTDGGADGNVFTDPNTVFLRQGLFVP